MEFSFEKIGHKKSAFILFGLALLIGVLIFLPVGLSTPTSKNHHITPSSSAARSSIVNNFPDSTPPSSEKVYKNSDYQFYYPQSWNVGENGNQVVVRSNVLSGELIITHESYSPILQSQFLDEMKRELFSSSPIMIDSLSATKFSGVITTDLTTLQPLPTKIQSQYDIFRKGSSLYMIHFQYMGEKDLSLENSFNIILSTLHIF